MLVYIVRTGFARRHGGQRSINMNIGEMIMTGEDRSTRRKICSSATLTTIKFTWTDVGFNPGLRGERLATNRLCHGTALIGISYPSQQCVCVCAYIYIYIYIYMHVISILTYP